ncbi:hypothetical protein Pla108_16080 [Botrimarina colliarenosi]|uniref:YtxH-like protein n=1 Tax=Botrimarina colliarenosi TaxID=2528001 RepID=A0A5C6ANH1_9BACT|nr:hypothetical protein [Botrimarina colliarenosi]TWU00656.1 hypothetical protein Pla108_16080 [Botrimarina colliarenosi]
MNDPHQKAAQPGCATTNRVEGYVQRHPEASILACVAGGALIGIGLTAFLTSSSTPPRRSATDLAGHLGRRVLDSIDSVTKSGLATVRDTIHRG